MKYLIPANTKVIPYSTRNELKGNAKRIQRTITFELSDVIKNMRSIDSVQRKFVEYYCLPIESINNEFDSVLVSVEDIIEN